MCNYQIGKFYSHVNVITHTLHAYTNTPGRLLCFTTCRCYNHFDQYYSYLCSYSHHEILFCIEKLNISIFDNLLITGFFSQSLEYYGEWLVYPSNTVFLKVLKGKDFSALFKFYSHRLFLAIMYQRCIHFL